jgi:hypothetical protein
LIIYLVICVISILMGQGILRLVDVKIDKKCSVYLAPVITLVFWTIFLGWGVLLGFPIKQLWMVGWSATLLLAIIGFRREDYHFLMNEWVLLAEVLAIPICLMAPYFWYGVTSYPGSWFWDGWSYIAYGQYIWEYPRGAEGGLAPLYQYAARLNNGRFVSSSITAFFSPVTGTLGNTQAASGYFLAWAVFVFSSACMLFAVVKIERLGRVFLLTYISISVFSGWLLNVVIANNYDNVLAISSLPAFAGVVYLVDVRDKRWAVVLGGLTAEILYCYPEMSPVVIGGAVVFVLHRIALQKAYLDKWLKLILGTTVVAIFLVSPWIMTFIKFFHNQLNAAIIGQDARPGRGYFPQLMGVDCFLGAFWGFWSPFQNCAGATWKVFIWKNVSNILAAVLSIVSLLGLIDLIRRKEWGLYSVIILLLCGAGVMILNFSYDYGAYKLILLNWWGVTFILVSGASLLLERFRENKTGWVVGLCLSSFLVLLILLNGARIIDFDKGVSKKNIQIYSQVDEIKRIVNEEAVIVNIHDPQASEWALYFLRDIPIYLIGSNHPYYTDDSLMNRAKAIDVSKARYLLTNNLESISRDLGKLTWAGGPYRLWRLIKNDWIVLGKIDNPNGIESWGGEQGFWMGKGNTELRLLSSYNGQAFIQGHFSLGPSLPDKASRHILISTDHGYETTVEIVKDGPQMYSIPLVAGMNRVILRPLDNPSLMVMPNGDSRPLLVGVRGLRVVKVNISSLDRSTAQSLSNDDKRPLQLKMRGLRLEEFLK